MDSTTMANANAMASSIAIIITAIAGIITAILSHGRGKAKGYIEGVEQAKNVQSAIENGVLK